MNRWALANPSMRIHHLLFLLCGALLIGYAVPQEPMLVFVGVVGLTICLMSIIFPIGMSYVLLILSSISIQYIFEIEMMGLDLQSFYKLGLIFLSVPAMVQYGIHAKRTLPIVAITAIFFTTYLFADRHPLLTNAGPIVTYIGMTAPFILLLIKWPKSVSQMHIRLLCFLPLISVACGVLFHTMGLNPLFVTEYSGAIRLQGANIPPHLAFLAFVAFLVSMIEIKRSPHRMLFYYVMMGINFLILLLTGTRGPLVAALAVVIVFVYDLIKQFMKGKTGLIIPLFGFIAILIVSVWLQLDNFKKRSFEQQSDSTVNLSGRTEAWEFFLKGVEDSPWFGRGLGSALVSNDGTIDSSFSVPHNEYIRFYYDGGIIGAILMFGALLIVFRDVLRRVPMDIKLYMVAFIFGFFVYSISDNTISSIQFIVPFCVCLNAYANVSQPLFRRTTI
jgi:O-antigen ligase